MQYLHHSAIRAIVVYLAIHSEPHHEEPVVVAMPPDPGEGEELKPRRQYAEDALAHLGSVYLFALCLAGGDQAEAEAVVEEVLLRAVDRWHTPHAASDRRIWLLGLCRREFARRHPSQDDGAGSGERLKSTVDAGLEALAATAPSAEINAAGIDEGSLDTLFHGEVMDAAARLPGAAREAVVLSDMEGLSYSEVAEVLGVGIDTAKGILFRGRRLLQQDLYRRAIERGDLEPPVRPDSASG
jgi:RNA polymerase sigma-70 factor, ECF subfamily